MLLFVYTTTSKRFVIFTCRHFKSSWNTTALSQSNYRNLSCSSIITDIYQVSLRAATNKWNDIIFFSWQMQEMWPLKKHTINGAQVEVSNHPFTSEEPELQVGHWDKISGSQEVVKIRVFFITQQTGSNYLYWSWTSREITISLRWIVTFTFSPVLFSSVDSPRIQQRMVFGTIWNTQGVQVAGQLRNWKSTEIQLE